MVSLPEQSHHLGVNSIENKLGQLYQDQAEREQQTRNHGQRKAARYHQSSHRSYNNETTINLNQFGI